MRWPGCRPCRPRTGRAARSCGRDRHDGKPTSRYGSSRPLRRRLRASLLAGLRRRLRFAARRETREARRVRCTVRRRAAAACRRPPRPRPGRPRSAGSCRGAMPSASATIALITSPWLTATHIASGAVLRGDRGVPVADRRRRPGLHVAHRLAAREGDATRVALHDLPQRLLGQLLELPTGPVAVPALGQPLVELDVERRTRVPRPSASAVCRQRSSGLDTTAASGSTASPGRGRRPPAAAPTSSSWTPGVRPASTPAVLAVERPCRTRRTVATRQP